MDRIEHMRSYFARPGHDELDVVTFASTTLRLQQQAIRKQLDEAGFAPAALMKILEVDALGAPEAAVDAPVIACVNGSKWIARCECGGIEFVDFDLALFMCCSCWNAAHGHAWRTVALPDDVTKAAVESVLLARPDEETRSWASTETVVQLVAQNVAHGVPVPLEDAAVVEAITAEAGVVV